MTANEGREQALAAEVEKWGIDIEQPLAIRAVAKSWFRAGFDAAHATLPVVPAATKELIAEAKDWAENERGYNNANPLASQRDYSLAELLERLADALEALAQTPEEEWEYQCRFPESSWADVQADHRCSGERRRRRPAGQWLPVEGDE